MNYLSLKNGLLDITEGVIVHQVNCKNVIGGGLSGAIIKKYPQVKHAYHQYCSTVNNLFGSILEVKINSKLIVANIFSQENYGNAYINRKVYTDYNKLYLALKTLCNKYDKVYIPKNIGCGLAGGDWNTLLELIKDLPLTIVEKKHG